LREKRDEDRIHPRTHDDLTNTCNSCVFSSDEVFGNHSLAGCNPLCNGFPDTP
jgi:hypothetical protein